MAICLQSVPYLHDHVLKLMKRIVQQFMRWQPDREWNCRRQQDEEKRKREQAQVLGKGGARSRLSFKISAT